MQETYFIKLKDGFNDERFSRVLSFLKSRGAHILIGSSARFWIVATLNQQLVDTIKKKPYVEVLGGVTFSQRDKGR